MSAKWILLILEDGVFHEESVCYAIKLAQRMSCSISVLMLVANTDGTSEACSSEREIFEETLKIISAKGIDVMGKIRCGDKASEFLKHLASNPSFETIVWGGGEEIVAEHHVKKAAHWFTKVKSTIQCPVVRPTIKDKNKAKHKPKEF